LSHACGSLGRSLSAGTATGSATANASGRSSPCLRQPDRAPLGAVWGAAVGPYGRATVEEYDRIRLAEYDAAAAAHREPDSGYLRKARESVEHPLWDVPNNDCPISWRQNGSTDHVRLRRDLGVDGGDLWTDLLQRYDDGNVTEPFLPLAQGGGEADLRAVAVEVLDLHAGSVFPFGVAVGAGGEDEGEAVEVAAAAFCPADGRAGTGRTAG
jgi:hypothetical protein